MKIQGMNVVDGTEAIEVTITQNDVRLGKKKSAHECAAARALCREHQAEAAIVHFSRAYIRKKGTWYRYAVPAMLRSEVVAFDRGGAIRARRLHASRHPTDAAARRSDAQAAEPKRQQQAENRQSPQAPVPCGDRRSLEDDSRLGVRVQRQWAR